MGCSRAGEAAVPDLRDRPPRRAARAASLRRRDQLLDLLQPGRLADRTGAAHWVDGLRGGPGVRALVVEDRLVGTGEIPAAPFDPAHLEERIDAMRRLMPAVARQVATNFGGVHYTEDDRRPGTPDTALFDDWY